MLCGSPRQPPPPHARPPPRPTRRCPAALPSSSPSRRPPLLPCATLPLQACNNRVVHRSNYFLQYAPDFRYQEALAAQSWMQAKAVQVGRRRRAWQSCGKLQQHRGWASALQCSTLQPCPGLPAPSPRAGGHAGRGGGHEPDLDAPAAQEAAARPGRGARCAAAHAAAVVVARAALGIPTRLCVLCLRSTAGALAAAAAAAHTNRCRAPPAKP